MLIHAPYPISKAVIIGVIALLMLCAAPSAHAYMLRNGYFPPEMSRADDLRQRVKIPGAVNINTASLRQLMILPGLDESIALKIIRSRPIAGIQEFYRLPGVNTQEIELLIHRLQPRVIFK